MNRNLKIILIVIWSIVAIGFTAILVYGISNQNGVSGAFDFCNNSMNSEVAVQKDEKVDLKNIDKINVDFSSSNIIIKTTEDINLRIIQKSAKTLTESEKFQIIKTNNEITIKKGNSIKFSNIFSFGNNQEIIEVYVPKNYNSDMDFETSSGNIEFDSDIELGNVNCEASSGNLFSNCNLRVKDINLEVSSGNISFEALLTNSYNIDASSGNIKINSLAGSGKLKTSSGNIKIQYKDITEESEATASSGDIDLVIPEGLSFEFSGECSSGKINSDFELNYKDKKHNEATGKVGSAPYKKIKARTSSGSINVMK